MYTCMVQVLKAAQCYPSWNEMWLASFLLQVRKDLPLSLAFEKNVGRAHWQIDFPSWNMFFIFELVFAGAAPLYSGAIF